MNYRELNLKEEAKICEIDAECYIHYAWREVNGVRKLVSIDWTDHELPNGLPWHIEKFKLSLSNGGKAFGCFDNNILVGYSVINAEIFGSNSKYILLDQLFISKSYRGKGIGKNLFAMCCDQAKVLGAERVYICAGSSEDTISFYFKIGCVEAVEVNQELYELDTNDFQLEFAL